jgi:hypothetical protein
MKPWLVYSLIVLTAIGILLAIAFATYDPQKNPALIEAQEKNQQTVNRILGDLENKLSNEHLDLIKVRDGEAEANLYARCTYAQPKKKANQELCQKVIARIAREDAAAEAAQKKAEDNW